MLASIDIGTNSVLMQVTGVSARGLNVLDDRMTITRLGQGVDRSGQLAQAAVARTLDALRDYRALARSHGAALVAVGTSALRDAQNARAFLDAAEAILGVPIEVISGLREAELTYLGATQGLGLESEARCVVDVGGGSTEIVCGTSERVAACASLDVGAVRLTERHSVGAPPSPATLHALDADVQRALDQSPVQPCAPLVAIAGTATTLAAIHCGMDRYDAARIHGLRMTVPDVLELATSLCAMSKAELARVPGLAPARADVMVAGTRVLLGVIGRAQANEIVISNGGVRMGLAVAALRNSEIDGARSSE